MELTKEQHRALESLGYSADDVSEDDISEADRVFLATPRNEVLIDIDGAIEPTDPDECYCKGGQHGCEICTPDLDALMMDGDVEGVEDAIDQAMSS